MAITEKELATTTEDPTRFGGFRPTTPTLAEAIPNEIKYYFEPLSQRIGEIISYGYKVPQDYDYKKYIPKGMDSYAIAFSRTTSPEHAAEVATFIRGREKLRQDMSDTPIGMSLVAALFNPINLIPIPLGHAMRAGRVSLGKTALRGGASLGALEFGMNVMNQEFDPVQSWTETITNTATAALFGGVTTGLFSVPAASRMNAIARVREQSEAIYSATRLATVSGEVTPDVFTRYQPKDKRFHGKTSDESLKESAEIAKSNVDSLEARRQFEGRWPELDEAKADHQELVDEIFFRALEAEGVKVDDIYRPTNADNFFYRFVPSPLKSALTSNFNAANNFIKQKFMLLAADGGSQLKAHEIGAAVPQSVHQKQVTDMGEFAMFYGSALQHWAADTNAPVPSGSLFTNQDVNATSVMRRISRSGNSIDDWLESVAYKRVTGQEMNPNELAASKLMDDYVAKWEERLADTDILRTRKKLELKLSKIEKEINQLKKDIDSREQELGPMLLNTSSKRLRQLQADRDNLKLELDTTDSLITTEPFFPRVWDISRVKENRGQLKTILMDWFRENPEIIRFVPGENDEPGGWAKIKLSTDEAAISKRADDALENIIDGTFNKDENIFVGSRRVNALASRQLNIPNKLVADYILMNPVNVLGNYTMRVSPRYHFAKAFGTNRENVVSLMRMKMYDAKVPRDQINKTILQFNHLYDRVVGRVVENPDAWNQRIATTLRDMASLTYLGAAGIAAVGDFGRVIMEHEGQNIARAAQAVMDPVIRNASAREVRIAGGALDMLLGSVFMRMVDDQNYNILKNGVMDKTKNVFHTLNLLGPVTTITKQFSGMLAGHEFIELSIKVAKGEASDFDITRLARHGINVPLALRIAQAPYQIDPKTKLILPNTEAWNTRAIIKTLDGNRVQVVQVEEGPPVVIKDGQAFVNTSLIENDLFANKVWTKPDKIPGEKPVSKFSAEYLDYDNKPWTSDKYGLREGDITSKEQWANFLTVHDFVMQSRGTFQNMQQPIFALSNDTIVRIVGNEFNVGQIVTDPAIARRVIDEHVGTGGIGYHQAAFIDSRGISHKGVIYMDLSAARKFYQRIHGSNKDAKAELEFLKEQLANREIDDITYVHRRAQYENANLFKTSDDFVEFLLYHELYHGNTPRLADESLPKYEYRLDQLAIDALRNRRESQSAIRQIASSYALDGSRRNAMPQTAFTSLTQYEDFLIQRAILEDDPAYSLKALSLRDSDMSRLIRKGIIDRKARRMVDESYDSSADLVHTFRTAVSTAINNTVLMASPADKPIMMDGVVYIRGEIGDRMGLPRDKKNPAYTRIENAFIALPLQFYAYSIAAANKTVGLMMQGAVRNRVVGAAAMFGLGYMVTAIRTPNEVWERMSIQDKIARAFDMSGIAALYSDLFYTGLQTSLALGGPNLTGGVLSPRFPQQPNMVDAVTNITGAASSWTADMVRSAVLFATGDYGPGAATFIKNLPFSNMWFLRGEVNEMARTLSRY